MSTEDAQAMNWNPFAAEILRDPGTGHRRLLERCPVHRYADFEPPFYTISRFEDVENALRDIETFSSRYGQGPRFTEPEGMFCDPPRHTHLRSLLQRAFTPRAIDALRAPVEALSESLVDAIMAGGEGFDFHDDFAFPLPVTIIAGLIGVPDSQLEQFKHWSDVQVAAMGAKDPSVFAADQEAFQAWVRDRIAGRRADIAEGRTVQQDLLGLIAGGREVDGALIPAQDAHSMLTQLLVGGNETTTSLMTNLIWRLLEEPAHWQALLEDPSLIETAVEESLRFDPPVLGLYRNTTREVELHGVTIPANSKVFINYAAANRDPAVFANPDVFDPRREIRRNMSFGLGVHFCLGAPMARMEAEVALRVLLRRMPGLRLLGRGERITPFFLWGRRRLPLAWR